MFKNSLGKETTCHFKLSLGPNFGEQIIHNITITKYLFISTHRVGLGLVYLKNDTITIALDGYAISNSPTNDPWL